MFRNRILTSYLTTHGWVEKKQIEFHGQIAFAWCNCAGVHGFGKAILLNIVHCNTTLHIVCVNHKCRIYTRLWNHKGNQSIAITSDLPRKWTQWKVFNYAHKRPIQVSNIHRPNLSRDQMSTLCHAITMIVVVSWLGSVYAIALGVW